MTADATSAEIAWAHSYDGYRRLAGTPEKLGRLLRSAQNSYAGHGRIPDWCGVDLLRGWAFFLARTDHHAGGDTLGAEWMAVLGALRDHPDAGPTDRPPLGQASSARVLLPTSFSTEPKRHRERRFLAAKYERLWEPHVEAINQFVDRIRIEIAQRVAAEHRGGLADHVHVPYVDPDSGGIRARVLFLLESPSRPAALGSGMLSADNNDETAKNMWHAYAASGMPRTHGLHWNAVPWFVGTEKKNAGVSGDQVGLGNAYLRRLLDLATDVRVVVAMGQPAQTAVLRLGAELFQRGIKTIEVIHPSPRNYNTSARDAQRKVHEAFTEALRIAC